MERKRGKKIARAEIGRGAKGENRVVDGNKNDGEDYFRAMRFEFQRSVAGRSGGTRWFIPIVKCDGNVPPSPPSMRK